MLSSSSKSILNNLAEQPAENKIKKQLKTALQYTTNVCLLGSSNKADSIKNTSGYVLNPVSRYVDTGYFTKDIQGVSFENLLANASYDSEANHLVWRQHKWNLVGPQKLFNCSIYVTPRFENQNPLYDSQFNLTDKIVLLLGEAMLYQHVRVGNCGAKAAIAAKYLWEHADGIKRIEVCGFENFDHAFVVVNREGNLQDRSTWGEAWLLDLWTEDGLIFHVKDFDENFKIMLSYADIQDKECKQLGITYLSTPSTDLNKIENNPCEIDLSKHQYPTYSKQPFIEVDYYYVIKNIYPKDFFKTEGSLPNIFNEHKKSFSSTLKAIDKNYEAKGFRVPI